MRRYLRISWTVSAPEISRTHGRSCSASRTVRFLWIYETKFVANLGRFLYHSLVQKICQYIKFETNKFSKGWAKDQVVRSSGVFALGVLWYNEWFGACFVESHAWCCGVPSHLLYCLIWTFIFFHTQLAAVLPGSFKLWMFPHAKK